MTPVGSAIRLRGERKGTMSDFKTFVDDYYRNFVHTLETFDRAPMQGVLDTLEAVQSSGATVWIAGNGLSWHRSLRCLGRMRRCRSVTCAKGL